MENNQAVFSEDILSRLSALEERVARLEKALSDSISEAPEAESDSAPELEDVPIDLSLDFMGETVSDEIPAVTEPEMDETPDKPSEEETPEELIVETVQEETPEEPIVESVQEETPETESYEPEENIPAEIEAEQEPAVDLADIPLAEEEPAAQEPTSEEPDADLAEDAPADDSVAAAEENEPEPAAQEPTPAEPEEDLPEDLFGESAPKAEPKPKSRRAAKDIHSVAEEKSGKAIVDLMIDKMAWYHDMPGTPVKSLRSAIALGDQVLFIRRLFRDDSALYQSTIEQLNSITSLARAVDYVTSTFPEWNMESEDVYRFMMAVRRKIK